MCHAGAWQVKVDPGFKYTTSGQQILHLFDNLWFNYNFFESLSLTLRARIIQLKIFSWL